MEYLEIKNWEEYQHYSKRNPPWIKLHVKILNDRNFTSLACASRGLLMQLWVLGSENEGKVPNDLEELKFRLRDSHIKQKDINLLIENGFLDGCKQVLADASKCSPETETETETETDKRQRQRQKERYLNHVFLTQQEYGLLEKDFGEIVTNKKIEDLDDYIGSTGKRYKSHYHTLRAWLRKDGVKKQERDEPVVRDTQDPETRKIIAEFAERHNM